MIYLDHNATTPIDPAVTAAMLPYLSHAFGNPSSEHQYGVEPRAALATARREIAGLIGAGDGRIVFTGSGSEADNLAIRGVVLAATSESPHVITQVTEHPAVLQACRALERWHGVDVTYLPVDGSGLVDPGDLDAAMTPQTVLVSIMAANNETGALQPVADLARIARDYDVLFHCDAAQHIGKLPFDVDAQGIDLVTVVGHKMYAPKGVGALWVRSGVPLEPLVYGGGQEYGVRAGTESVALAVGLGAAARLASGHVGDPYRIQKLRDALQDRLSEALPGRVVLNGPSGRRLPNTLNLSIEGTIASDVLRNAPELAASTGSACHSGDPAPSPVLTAMGVDRDRALAAIRLSLGRWTTVEDVDTAVQQLAAATLTGGD
ncbi:cysteine desulfurase [Kribbella turkmenica]|uniref:Cysteine desulfurase n=1 Tax=Kribbella turkmenica TaxID=2530375 RepID=A0A4R4WC22_9ACTN|nr:cysteine desulfurase family protein [Kribbella turkmenica]TDD16362.1 cysteine desulfurase [Kribbella turkmenica]